MTVQPARKRKPSAMEETARVLLIARAIDLELRSMYPPQMILNHDSTVVMPGAGWDILTVADRIAARTED
jgi:hypothetical protein